MEDDFCQLLERVPRKVEGVSVANFMGIYPNIQARGYPREPPAPVSLERLARHNVQMVGAIPVLLQFTGFRRHLHDIRIGLGIFCGESL